MNVYACSDIHGQYRLFKQMLKATHFSDSDLLYILGDVIDRGPDSIPMLQDIMSRDNILCLLGNHELMMYTEYRHPEKESYWLYSCNGGAVTQAAFRKLPAEEQESILRYIGDMALQVDLTFEHTRFLLSHSDFIANANTLRFKDVPYNDAFNTVWNSPWRMWEHVPKSKYKSDGRVHVIGHVPAQRIDDNLILSEAYIDPKNNIIDIDLGCAAIGSRGHAVGHSLCCLNLTAYDRGAGRAAFSYYG